MKTAAILLTSLASATAFSFTGKSVSHSAPVTSSSLCMKTIAIFGASGLTSSECVYQALKNGDNVIGLTRNPSKLVIPAGSGGDKAGQPLTDAKLTMIQGDVTNPSDVAKVFAAGTVDGVIVGLGGKTSDVGDTMLTDGTVVVMNEMKKKDVKRLAVITSIGAGDSKDQAPFFFKVNQTAARLLGMSSM